MRLTVRVRPGSSRTRVGGAYGDGPDAPLIVAVTARAVDGKATEAVLEVLAAAFGVHRRAVTLISGGTARTKVVEIAGDERDATQRLTALKSG